MGPERRERFLVVRSGSRGGQGLRPRLSGPRWGSLRVVLGPEETGHTRVSKAVKAEEWGPRCSLEGTLKVALLPEGTWFPLGGEAWEFAAGGRSHKCRCGSSLRDFQGILGPEPIGSDVLR